jgi:hypothetical protein
VANEILAASSDFLVASVLEMEILTKLSSLINLRGSPALVDFSPMASRGSLVLAIPLAGWDSLVMTAPGEATGVSNTALDSDQITLTIARQAIQLQISDELLVSSLGGAMNVERLAQAAASAYINRHNDLTVGLFGGVTASVGTSGADLTLDDVVDATQTLMRANNTDSLYAMLHGQQMSDLQNSLRGEGGALSFSAPTAEMIAAKGKGFAGSYLGVDFWINNRVATANAGADRAGCMWSRGAFGYAEATHPLSSLRGSVNPQVVSPVLIEFERTGTSGLNTVIASAFLGVAMVEDARAVKIVTDA